jgi:hypothetical protein
MVSEETMARPLTKHDRNGNLYVRQLSTERTLESALDMDLSTLSRSARILDPGTPGFLPPECLVHLIRDARRRNDETRMNELLPILLQRCEDALAAAVSNQLPDAAYLREEILAQFSELFAMDGSGDNPDELDFFEVRFNRAFKTFRIDVLRKETRIHANQVPVPDTQEGELTSDDELFVRMSDAFRAPPAQGSYLSLRRLAEAISTLPADEQKAVVLCHVLGYDEESEDPAKITAATLCGVTGRTIRNRLARAATMLVSFKEEL